MAGVVALYRVSSVGMAGNPFPWTWALDRAPTAAEVAGSGQGIDIDNLGNTAAAAEDEGKARREHCAQFGHWEEVWLAARVVSWVGESSWPCAPRGGRSPTLSAAISFLGQHSRCGLALRKHCGRGKAGETLLQRFRRRCLG